jgi:nitrate reductase gamma subunit
LVPKYKEHFDMRIPTLLAVFATIAVTGQVWAVPVNACSSVLCAHAPEISAEGGPAAIAVLIGIAALVWERRRRS